MSVRVLVVEDDPLIGSDLCATLEGAGHRVVALCDTLGTARRHLDDAFDLALLDVDLPDGRSFEVAEHLRGAGRAFAFVSGSREADVPEALRDAPFLSKPWTPGALVRLVGTLAHAGPPAG